MKIFVATKYESMNTSNETIDSEKVERGTRTEEKTALLGPISNPCKPKKKLSSILKKKLHQFQTLNFNQ